MTTKGGIVKVFIFLSLVLFSEPVYSQQTITLNGSVTDATNGAPLIFANIAFIRNGYGTITNEKGEFLIKIPEAYRNDTITVSFLGYAKKKIPVSFVLKEFASITLNPLPICISQVNVYPKNPQKIISEAIAEVKENFITAPMSMNAFYREIIWENKNKIQHIEAVLDIYKGSYLYKKDKDRIRIIKGREFIDLKPSALWDHLYFVNGPYEIIQLDIAKYPMNFIKVAQTNINFLNPKHYKFYNYSLIEVESKSDKRDLYIIHFKPAKKRALFEGKLFIDKKTMAILAMEYYISPNKISRTRLLPAEHELGLNKIGISTKAVDFHCLVVFKKVAGKYVLSNSKMFYRFLFFNNDDSQLLMITNSIDFVVTSIDIRNVKPFKQKHSIWKNVSLTKQLGKYNPGFWQNYNVIQNVDFRLKVENSNK